MISLLNLGVSDPLTFGMAHPLTDRLERLTSVKVSKTKSRLATGLLLLTSASISAPFTIATEKVEKPDFVSVNLTYPQPMPKLGNEEFPEIKTFLTQRVGESRNIDITSHRDDILNHSVTLNRSDKKEINAKLNVHAEKKDGRHSYDIEITKNNFEAYKLNPDGSRQSVSPEDIDGFDPETAKDAAAWSFSVGDGNQLSFSAEETHFPREDADVVGESLVLRAYDLGYLYTMTHANALAELAIVQKQRGLSSTDVGTIKRALKDITFARGGALIAEAPNPPIPPSPPSTHYAAPTVPTPPAEPAYIGKGMQFSNGKLIASDGPYTIIRDGEAKTMFEGRELTDTRSRILAAETVLDSIDSLLDGLEDMKADRRDAYEDMMEAREEALEAKLEAKIEAREAAMEAQEEAIEAQEEQRQEALERHQEKQERIQEKQERIQEKIERANERVRAKTSE